MALVVCHAIAYIQILSAGYNLWGVNPLIIFDIPFGRNTIMIGLFMIIQILGFVGAIMILQQGRRLGFILSILHHVLLLPALVITGTGLVVLMDDRLNLTLLFMNTPNGGDVGLYWSLGWNTVFKQVTANVVTGSTYIGVNLFAMACIFQLWVGMDELEAAAMRQQKEMRRRERQATRKKPLALPAPQRRDEPPERLARPQQAFPQERMRPPRDARMRPPQAERQSRRPPSRRDG
ncbi:MAG: hypothetical protein KTR19_02340 [Hyphomicrobiales bacterium]|nr:hypothetical protein [Hyphomicrobiales bacterium]